MLRIDTRTQPTGGTLASLLHSALADPGFKSLDAAIAYVRSSGVDALQRDHEADIDRLRCRWLSSLDWCRSDAVALDALDHQPRSSVRIFDGVGVIGRPSCSPARSFHPKGFLFSGPRARLLISGSGNLSRNGITRGVELDTVIEVRDPSTPDETAAWEAIETVKKWFAKEWVSASPYRPLHAGYKSACAESAAMPPTTDDDWSPPSPGRRGFTAVELISVRRASVFWVEAGNLTRNLGPGNPGSQLMTRALTRVFFGFPPTSVAKQTHIGTINMRYAGVVTNDLSIEFAHNGMDRVNLPKPGQLGPPSYDNETLVIEKRQVGGRFIYDLRVAKPREKRALRIRSEKAGSAFKMPGQSRQFGFCIG
jgi:hypothetical protein